MTFVISHFDRITISFARDLILNGALSLLAPPPSSVQSVSASVRRVFACAAIIWSVSAFVRRPVVRLRLCSSLAPPPSSSSSDIKEVSSLSKAKLLILCYILVTATQLLLLSCDYVGSVLNGLDKGSQLTILIRDLYKGITVGILRVLRLGIRIWKKMGSKGLVMLSGASLSNANGMWHRSSCFSFPQKMLKFRSFSSTATCSSIQPPDVSRLAKTAQISLTPNQVEEFAPKIQQVIDWFGQLQDVDLQSIEPSIRADTENNLRDNAPETFDNRDDMIASVPNYEEPYIKVPKVFPQSFPTIGMPSEMTNPAYLQFNSAQQLVSCCGGLINNMGIIPPDMGLRRNISAPLSLPETFLDSSCFNQILPSSTWEGDFQNLYNVAFDQGRTASFPSQPCTGLVEASNLKMEM